MVSGRSGGRDGEYNCENLMTNNNNEPGNGQTEYLKRDKYNGNYKTNGVNGNKRNSSVRVSMIAVEDDNNTTHNTSEARPDNSRTGQCSCNQGGCGPLLANNLAYFGATATFMFAVNIAALPKVPFPVIGNGLPESMWLDIGDVSIVVPLLLWSIHFFRRFTEVLFVHRYTRTMPYGESIGASVYYWGFGFWIGYSANYNLEYSSPTWSILIPGIVLFTIGEIGNCLAHVMLAQLRGDAFRLCRSTSNLLVPSRRIMPNTWLFKLVSCPNYTFEIITWLGYGLAVFTLPAALFFISSVITLLIYGYKKHKAYKVYFDGNDGRPLYPPRRKALIPFIF